jgi:lipopolysaccharide export system permease protein
VKTLDWYIIRKFLGTFVFTMLLLMSIAIVIDFTEKVDNFMESKLTAWEIITQWYLHFIPWIGLMLSPLFVFIAVIFFTTRLANNSEITVILNSGVSFYRMLVPYMLCALFLTGVFYWCNHYWVPRSNANRVLFEQQYVSKTQTIWLNNRHVQVTKDTLGYMQTYDSQNRSGFQFCVEVIRDRKLLYKLNADRAQWDTTSGKWRIYQWVERTYVDDNRDIIRKGTDTLMALNVAPEDFNLKLSNKETMPKPELDKFIASESRKGTEGLAFFYVEKYRRSASAFSTIILTLMGVSLTSRKIRGGLGIYIVSGLVLSGAYVIMQQFSTVFSTKGNLDPLLGTWIPNIFFAAISIILLWRAPK